MTHQFHPSIIREYDIRGIVGETLSASDALHIGKAFGTMVRRAGGKNVVMGFDGRTHSPELATALTEGILSTGLNVQDIGLGPTPMVYFATVHGNASAGIMVTGSHNPPEHNGFKMMMAKHLPGGGSVFGDAIKKLAALSASGDFEGGKGTAKKMDVRDLYTKRLREDYASKKPLRIVWDCGNGSGGDIVRRLTALLPGTHTLLFADIDGTFPNHHPDPTVPENLTDLIRVVKEQKADIGVAFDGDADRIGAVDNMGRILAGDQLLAIFAADVLANHKGATIIGDVKASQSVFDRIAKLGGKPLMWKTGHSHIKSKMVETRAPLAGEMSGHIFFADHYYGYDDGIYAAVRLAQMVASSDKPLAAWRDELPSTFTTPEIRLPVDETEKFGIVVKIANRLKETGIPFSDIDGVRVTTPDGWWLIRSSNTQAILVARAEADTEMGLSRLTVILKSTLKDCGLTWPENPAASH